MASKIQVPELKCLDPENYKEYFRVICWSGTRKSERRGQKRLGRKEKLRRLKSSSNLAVSYAPALLANPSPFAVYATVRKAVLSRWRHLQGPWAEYSDDSDYDDATAQVAHAKLPKITGIGLRTVFSLISQARFTDAQFCEHSLRALLDVLQGHSPEELSQEPTEIIQNLHSMLTEVAAGSGPSGRSDEPSELTALASSCLLALSVARGETELMLHAVASLVMANNSLTEQYILIPLNLTSLQRSVQSVILGPPARNQWLNHGVPHQSLVTSFPIDLPIQLTSGSSDLVVRSLVSDGCFLYVYTSKGLLKIGSGYGSSIRQHVYYYKHNFFAIDRHGWLGCCKNDLYVRIGRKKTEVYQVDRDSLEVKNVIRLDVGQPAPVEPKCAVFSDGEQLGLIVLTHYDSLTIRMYDTDYQTSDRPDPGPITLTSKRELNVPLLRKRTMILGRPSYEDGLSRRPVDLDSPVAIQVDDNDEDPLLGIHAGQDFALLYTASGVVFYTGKGQSLGYKAANSQVGRWTLMKETIFARNDDPSTKKCKVVQVAVGHEGVHAVLVLDNGTALFTGVARRGEDGDSSKLRRMPKPTRPKKIFKAEGHYVAYAACNHGSTALVTRQGLLLMFGKDTQHCEPMGLVTGLRHERVIQVALGKAHAVALNNFGQVYTFGINNKGQCGREFGYTKEKSYQPRRRSEIKEETPICPTVQSHVWTTDVCRVCVLCRHCTGFSSSCRMSTLPNRVPGEICGCGEGDSGCSTCDICRRCAETFANAIRPDMVLELDDDSRGSKSDKESRYQFDGVETERESGVKVNCLPPARVAIPGGHRVSGVACGLHHTVLLTEHGDVLTFGSNQYGQLGAGDISAHHRVVRVRVPKASGVAAGSNHTAVLTRDGELYTFGSYQKGALGRPRLEESSRTDRTPIWYATPGKVPRIGPRYGCKAIWVMASGDQTFVQISESLINTDTLFSSTITANSNSIVILPNRPEHAFKCITINKLDGTCNTWTGPEQVDFVNTLACLDPLYDVLWCYQPQLRVMKCYNILAFDSHKLQRCCVNETETFDTEYEYPNFGSQRRLEDFKNLENFEVMLNNEERTRENLALSKTSVLNQELAIPCALNCSVTRMHGALHLLGCLDSLIYAHENRLNPWECRRDCSASPVTLTKDDYFTVNRFESHGGGWGYSGLSVEAIRFMCDTDIMLGGYGLFGGRGEYSAKIKLFYIGIDGGDHEGDGDLIAESDEIVYECAPRDKFPVMFDEPMPLMANRWYVAWACINGPSSDCGSSGQAMVINDEIGFHFKTSKKSNNGTDVNAGQIPSLLYNLLDQTVPVKYIEPGETSVALTKNISRKVTVACFKSLITLLQWSWNSFKEILLETNGQVTINYQKLTVMKHQKRLVYVIRACLRLTKSYINEIYPQNPKKRNTHEYMSYFESIAEVRNLIQIILSDSTPTCAMLPKKPGKNKTHRICYVQFALEMTNSILQEAHETITCCFYAFFPTPTLKWSHLCSLLFYVKEGNVPSSQIRELTATCAAMCGSRSLRDVLQYIVSVTQACLLAESRRPDSKIIHVMDVPSKSATVPRSSSKPPPIPPRSNQLEHKTKESETKTYTEWHLLDVVPKLLDIVTMPIKHQMMTRQCGQPHDHGEIKQNEKLSEFCCKLITRIIAELSHSAVNVKEELDTNTVTHLVTPSRFMRVNQTRAWNTGNGSPDAICFTVDRPGIVLVGVHVFVGMGNYEFSLELLHDVRLRSGGEETNPAHCWVSLEIVHGSYSAVESQHDMVPIKFERPVPLKEDLRYAIRLCNHGGRTANGDCGLPSVEGPDGTSFRFASCSLSFNGTTLARGQIPCLIYYSTSKSSLTSESSDNLVSALRNITLQVATTIIRRCSDLLCSLRNTLTSEDLRRNGAVLQRSPVINVLVPYTLASLDTLHDAKSVIKVLEMIHTLLPHVTAMNALMPAPEDLASVNTNYYTWVESEHPYRPATVNNIRVLFPSNVSWIVLEMDPRSSTAQPEDTLTIYAVAGVPYSKCHCSSHTRALGAPFLKRLVHLSTETCEVEELCDDSEVDTPCTHYNCTYVSVTPKMSNVQSDYPQRALLVPGNEVIFSLETASDYLKEYNKSQSGNDDSRFGFRCLCVGYEDTPYTTQKAGLTALEMDLIYTGASCASRLLAPDLDIPPLAFSTIVEVQVLAMIGTSPTSSDVDSADYSEALLLSRGLELSSPPSIHQVLDGQPLLRSVSTERQFLSDFVAGAESTAGGRLARWLAPISRVEPSKCELKAPNAPVRPAAKVSLPIVVRDQYGEAVSSPALKVEVVVQRLEESGLRQSRVMVNENRGTIPDEPYHPTVRDTMTFHAISMMKAYQTYSFEELRLASGQWGELCSGAVNVVSAGLIPAERLTVQLQPDGTYVASWTPRAPGVYMFRCTLDDQPVPQELTIEVADSLVEGPVRSDVASPPRAKLLHFPGHLSAGLRVRASPSLQAEALGKVPPRANLAYVEQVINKDGTWVRLSKESMQEYAEGCTGVAWCLEHHRQLDRDLLVPVEAESPQQVQAECMGNCDGYNIQGGIQNWANDEEIEYETNDLNTIEDKGFQVTSIDADESDSSLSRFVFGLEPSKRSRIARNEAVSSSRIMQRRSNGNSDELCSPVRQRSSDNVHVNTILETEIGDDLEEHGVSKLAQTGTQTSPDNVIEDNSTFQLFPGTAKEGRTPSGITRPVARGRPPVRVSPPPLPARAPPPPRKPALSPSQAECLRAIFAALLWHEGIVHDAIACAAFLKFHPQLPKQGARVITRGTSDTSRHQRHSVEVGSAGQYLRIQQSTLDTLSRSGTTAFTNRLRKNDFDTPIREEDTQAPSSDTAVSTPLVVNVLPPALRALVALWDALYDSDQLNTATDKLKREVEETNENEDLRPLSMIRKKRDWKTSTGSKTPYSVNCELCGGAKVQPPLAAHMRQTHPGCRAPTTCGYSRAGVYRVVHARPPAYCGQVAQGHQLWYILCDKCRDGAIKASSTVKQPFQPKTKTISEGYERMPPLPEIDHHVMRENAVFLLDLAPLTNSESPSSPSWQDTRSPPTPPGSVWLPAPPFQCLQSLGAAPKASAFDAQRYHSLGRPPTSVAPVVTPFSSESQSSSQFPRVHRSVSMGQAGGSKDLAHAARTPLFRNLVDDDQDTLTGAGLSLLSQPSAALQKLVSCGEWTSDYCAVSAFEPPHLDPAALLRSSVLTFVLARRDLHSYRQKMDAAVRINTVRQYAFEALNWLLRSTTQPTSAHDVMWWFCTALDRFARIVPPPLAMDDKDNPLSDCRIPTASASAICPGGRSARNSRSAFHKLLGSVSALAASLHPSSASALQAVRCWAAHYSPHDRLLLHRSQVFNVISKILSHPEDGVYEESMLGALHESYHSYLNKESYVWTCPDVTGWCDISVSSRQGMAGALTDGSTETFWESGDEDRNKVKWIQITYPGGSVEDRPHIVCVHIDNTRDTASKTILATFLFSSGTSEDLHRHDCDVDIKSASWLCYTLPRVPCPSVRVRCELRGPEASVRVRQVRVLGLPCTARATAVTPARVLHALCETDTLRVFKLLTSQVFGKLLEWERTGSDSGGEGATVDDTTTDDSDLREHVVGILFAGHKLTSLQKQVMSHIVCAVGCEAARVRDDWETMLLCAETNDELPRNMHLQDNCCFEMLSLLLALSGSSVGRVHLAQRSELLSDLLALLHTGSERVQRQVITLLRRIIAEIPPQKMLAAVNYGNDINARVTLLDHLVSYLSKAITLQLKVKGAGTTPTMVTMGSSVTPAPPATWFMRGDTTKKHAHLVAKLLGDMAEDKISPAWGIETRNALTFYTCQVSQIPEIDRRPAKCITLPTIWLAVAALCVCDQAHIDVINKAGDRESRRGSNSDRPYCSNHDDGSTIAVIECKTCGTLCAECDRFLHLNRATRSHHRQICKEEEGAIRIDIHEGCGRAKLFWLLLLVDRRTLKGLAEFRGMETGISEASEGTSTMGLAGVCRFCGARGNCGLLSIGNVCADQQCQEHSREACNRVLACGHACNGVRGERSCLPCLFGCSANDGVPLRQDADDMCMICFTDPLQAAPALQLKCGHVFHLHCCKKVLANKWIGPRITFSFAQCPICKEDMNHWTLEELLAPIRDLREEVKRKAEMRLQYEGAGGAGTVRGGKLDPAAYAMERYAYYVCHKCGKAYFGGLARCEAETSGWWEPAELVCGACSDVTGARTCPKHGADFLEYKCRYCCSVAVFFCFGTSHFCNACHDDFQRVTNIPKHQLPQCPAGPKGEQLPGTSEECPLRIQHPPTGEEFALGCGVCRNAHAF